MATFQNDSELFDFIKKNLYVAAVCDILDELGHRNQAMHQRLRPLLPNPENCGFIGRARTFRWMETDYIMEENPYGLEIEAMDSLKAGDVAVHSTDYSGTNAPWGELMSTISKLKGVAGCVCDSQIRDCVKIMRMGFPVYYSGIRPLDSKGRAIVQAYDVPVHCGEVLVHQDDIIYADFDGIVVVPKALEQDVFHKAEEKVNKENLSRRELLSGKSLREVYNKYKAL
jgi:regulator of RNase E activity RraA